MSVLSKPLTLGDILTMVMGGVSGGLFMRGHVLVAVLVFVLAVVGSRLWTTFTDRGKP